MVFPYIFILVQELQCSDWSCRPLSEEQILYAAADAYYLLEIFSLFEQKVFTDGIFAGSLELFLCCAYISINLPVIS